MSTEHAPSVDELPKISPDLAQAVMGRVELKKVETQEKQILPTKEDIQTEKQHKELTDKIEEFNTSDLKHAETQEKQILPTQEDISREKTIEGAAHFDKSALKHVEIHESHNVEVIDS
ncbi:hypothetical protein WR25_00999 [Diploscapter pachys]|uniref:Thymosin beta n=1 Tax=Diploscapter pachys TaxID=2018661 RepID=A0A2A2LG91_9BILA|nr:hypothetical protein WR25_00999 [Diploscapter pachys]